MSHHTQTRVRSRIVPPGLASALIVVAVPFAGPAAAKEPVREANPCAPITRNAPPAPGQARADCESRAAALREATGQTAEGSGGSDAGVIAGGAALLALTTVGGVLVATRRRSAPETRTATQI
jgi:hypothetical protein